MGTNITITKVNPPMSQHITDFIDEYCYDVTEHGELRILPHLTPAFLVEKISDLFKKHSFSENTFIVTFDTVNERSSFISISWWEFNKVQLMTIFWEED